jgi:hypothetical protein
VRVYSNKAISLILVMVLILSFLFVAPVLANEEIELKVSIEGNVLNSSLIVDSFYYYLDGNGLWKKVTQGTPGTSPMVYFAVKDETNGTEYVLVKEVETPLVQGENIINFTADELAVLNIDLDTAGHAGASFEGLSFNSSDLNLHYDSHAITVADSVYMMAGNYNGIEAVIKDGDSLFSIQDKNIRNFVKTNNSPFNISNEYTYSLTADLSINFHNKPVDVSGGVKLSDIFSFTDSNGNEVKSIIDESTGSGKDISILIIDEKGNETTYNVEGKHFGDKVIDNGFFNGGTGSTYVVKINISGSQGIGGGNIIYFYNSDEDYVLFRVGDDIVVPIRPPAYKVDKEKGFVVNDEYLVGLEFIGDDGYNYLSYSSFIYNNGENIVDLPTDYFTASFNLEQFIENGIKFRFHVNGCLDGAIYEDDFTIKMPKMEYTDLQVLYIENDLYYAFKTPFGGDNENPLYIDEDITFNYDLNFNINQNPKYELLRYNSSDLYQAFDICDTYNNRLNYVWKTVERSVFGSDIKNEPCKRVLKVLKNEEVLLTDVTTDWNHKFVIGSDLDFEGDQALFDIQIEFMDEDSNLLLSLNDAIIKKKWTVKIDDVDADIESLNIFDYKNFDGFRWLDVSHPKETETYKVFGKAVLQGKAYYFTENVLYDNARTTLNFSSSDFAKITINDGATDMPVRMSYVDDDNFMFASFDRESVHYIKKGFYSDAVGVININNASLAFRNEAIHSGKTNNGKYNLSSDINLYHSTDINPAFTGDVLQTNKVYKINHVFSFKDEYENQLNNIYLDESKKITMNVYNGTTNVLCKKIDNIDSEFDLTGINLDESGLGLDFEFIINSDPVIVLPRVTGVTVNIDKNIVTKLGGLNLYPDKKEFFKQIPGKETNDYNWEEISLEDLIVGNEYMYIAEGIMQDGDPYKIFKIFTFQEGTNLIEFSADEISHITFDLNKNNIENAKVSGVTLWNDYGLRLESNIPENVNGYYVLNGNYYKHNFFIQDEWIWYNLMDKNIDNWDESTVINGDIHVQLSLEMKLSINGNRIDNAKETSFDNVFLLQDEYGNRIWSIGNDHKGGEAKTTVEFLQNSKVVNVIKVDKLHHNIKIKDINPGIYTLKYIVDIPDFQAVVLENVEVIDGRAFKYLEKGKDGNGNHYFEFEISDSIDYSVYDQLIFKIQGFIPEDVINMTEGNDNLDLRLRDNYIKVYKISDQSMAGINNVEQDIRLDSSYNRMSFETRFNSDNFDFNNNRGSKYRVVYTGFLYNQILDNIYDNLFNPNDNNHDQAVIHSWLRIRDDYKNESGFISISDGIANENVNAETVPDIKMLEIVKELIDSEIVIKDLLIRGSETEIFMGDISNLKNTAQKIEIGFESINEISFNDDLDIFINGINANYTTFNGVNDNSINKLYRYTMSIDIPEGTNLSDVKITIKGENGLKFSEWMKTRFDRFKNHEDSLYLKVLDQNGSVLGFRPILYLSDEVVVDPQFMFGSEDEPPFYGSEEEKNDGHFHRIRHELELLFTSMGNYNRVLVDGVSRSVNGEIPFVLTLGRRDDKTGRFAADFEFIDYRESCLNDIPQEIMVPGSQARTDYMLADWNDIDNYHKIRIDRSLKNEITLTFTDDTGMIREIEFDYYPNHRRDVMEHADFSIDQVGGPNEKAMIKIDRFIGDTDNIKLILYKQDGNDEIILAEYDRVLSETVRQRIHTNDDGSTWTEDISEIVMDIGNGWSNLSSYNNNDDVFGKIHYKDIINENYTFEFDSYLNNSAKADYVVSSPDRDFKGIVEIDGTDYYRMKLWLNDRWYLDNRNTLTISFLDKNNQPLNVNYILEGIRDEWETENLSADFPYREAYLYIDNYQEDMKIIFENVQDFLGNTKDSIRFDFTIHTRIKSTLRDTGLNILPDKILHIIRETDIPDLSLDILEWPHTSRLETGNEGRINAREKPGKYFITTIEDRSDISEHHNDSVGINAESTYIELDIPFLSTDLSYINDIIIPDNNIEGNLVRDYQYELRENLLFLDEETYLAWVNANQALEDEGNLTNEEIENLRRKKEVILKFFAKTILTDKLGNFDAYFKPDTYYLIGKYFSSIWSFQALESPVEFIVPETGILTISDLDISQFNVLLSIDDSQNSGYSNISFGIEEVNGSYNDWLHTNRDRVTALMLTNPGEYYIQKVRFHSDWDTGLPPLMYISDGHDRLMNFSYQGLGSVESFDLVAPAPNSYVEFQIDGIKAPRNNSYSIEFEGDHHSGRIGTSESIIDFSIPVGDYNIIYFDDDRSDKVFINQSFTVTDAGYEDNQIIVDVSSVYNTCIILKNEDNIPLKDARVQIKNESKDDYTSFTNEEGKAYFYFDTSDGNINAKVDGVCHNDNWIWFHNNNNIDASFTVSSSHNSDNRCEKIVVTPTMNFRGTIEDENGDLIKEAWLHIEDLNTHNNFGTDLNRYGEFERALEPGTYLADSVHLHNSDTRMEIGYMFKVIVDGNNKKVVVDMNDNPVQMPVTLTKLKPNFYGYLYNKEGYPYKTDGTHQWMKMLDMDAFDVNGEKTQLYKNKPWLFEKHLRVNTSDNPGYFEENIDPSKTYKVISTGLSDGHIEFTIPISIIVSREVPNILQPVDTNFYGWIKGFNNESPHDAGINVLHSDADIKDGEWINTYEGYFERDYEVGKEIYIRHIGYRLDSSDDWFNTGIEKEYIVGNETKGLIFKPNTKGIIDAGSLVDENTGWVGIRIFEILTRDDFNTDQEYEDYKKNRWQYEKWFNGRITNDLKIEYLGYFEPGNYSLDMISIDGKDMYVKQDFAIIPEEADSEGRYIVSFDFSPNITGSIKENGAPVKRPWVNFIKLDNDWNHSHQWNNNDWFGVSGGNDGVFQLKLNEGKYMLENYHTRNTWEDGEWVDGKHVDVRYYFQVDVNGDVYDKSGDPLQTIDVEPNVTGEAYIIFEGSEIPLYNGYISIHGRKDNGDTDWSKGYWTNTSGSSNEFMLMLPDGKYIVKNIGSNSIKGQETDIEFDISNGSIVNVLPEYLNQDGNLIVKPSFPNFKGVAYVSKDKVKPLKYGWILLKPKDASKHDWDKAKWIKTNKDGEFETHLKNQDWCILDLSTNNKLHENPIVFGVDGEIITPETPGIEYDAVSKTVDVYIPDNNLEISVLKPDGINYADDWGVVIILPEGIDDNDMDNTIFLPYEPEKFDGNIEWGAKGIFPEGNYSVIGFKSHQFSYQVNEQFTIVSGEKTTFEITKEPPNLTANVKNINNETATMGKVYFARVDENGNQVAKDGTEIDINQGIYDPEFDICWEHAISVDVKNGYLETLVRNGLYRVVCVISDGRMYIPIMPDFEIASGISVELDIVNPDTNITVTIEGVHENIDSETGVLSVYHIVNGTRLYVDIGFDSKNEDGDYIFKGTLSDGDYTAQKFITDKGFIDIDNGDFTVNGSADKTIDLSDGKVNVSGIITISGEGITDEIWITIENTATNEEKDIAVSSAGEYLVILDKNSEWKVIGRTTYTGGYKVTINQPVISVPDATDYSFNFDID